MDQEKLRQRVQEFLEAVPLPKTKFAEQMGFRRETYYRWIKGNLDLSQAKCEKIDEYISKLGF